MAGLKDAILSIKTKLQTLTDLQFVAIWNNQLSQTQDGQIYDFPKPAAFIEARIPNSFLPLGQGYSQSDITFAIHIVHEQFDAGNGNYEQNTDVYDLKRKIMYLLTNWQPAQCGKLMKIAEVQDYEHNNLYHYIIEFLTGLIDNDADASQGDAVTTPPTTLNLTITIHH